MNKLIDIASVLRSKNAGPLQVTFDIMFENKESYERVKNCGVVTKKKISEIYNTKEENIIITEYDIVNSIKITMLRKHVSGDVLDDDIYGCQQHVPLAQIIIP